MALPADAAAHNDSAAQIEVSCVTAGHTGLTVPTCDCWPYWKGCPYWGAYED